MSKAAGSFLGALQIGRYFNVVSIASSATFVGFLTGLAATGAFHGTPELARLVAVTKALDLSEAGLFALATLLVGLMLHPLQFALVQFLEGYWGSSHLSILAMDAVAEVHVSRWAKLDAADAEADDCRRALSRLSEQFEDPIGWDRLRRRLRYLKDETERLRARYPERGRILPTRLGNRLRAGEDAAGEVWGIDAIAVAPTISLVADAKDDRYLADTTAEVDVAVRFCLVWSLTTVAGVVALWRDGVWLSVPIATYALAYLSYRGAAVAADEQGAAVNALIALNRFALYDRLRVKHPDTTSEERDQNKELMALLRGDPEASVEYVPTEPTASGTASS